MSQQEISCGLDYAAAPDLQGCLTEALHVKYSFIVAPIVHPRFRRHHALSTSGVAGFTRSDMLLCPQDWTVRVVGKLSAYLDVDAPSPEARRRHEDCLNEELAYCKGLGLPAIMLKLHGAESNNLARILHSYFETSHNPSIIWVQVPMLSIRKQKECIAQDKEDSEDPWNESWSWWSTFHEKMNFDKWVGVVLELSAELPSERVLKRWLGEPVKAVIIPTSIFISNKKGYPVLSRAHQQLVASMVEHDAQVIVSGARRYNIDHYAEYLHRIWQRRPNVADDPMLTYARGWEDFLQTPLQPLADNLDTHTYNVFEKDPVKYDQYQRAIAKALTELQKKDLNENHLEKKDLTNGPQITSEEQSGDALSDKVFTVMVLGAGRGPLVRAALNAAALTETKIKVIVVEKNPCAVVVLRAQAREVWRRDDVSVLAGDMRHVNLADKADIIVSELLGSWGDNELSPECLDGAARLLKPSGISIPSSYTSHVAPISSPRLWAAAKAVSTKGPAHPDKNLETLWVVYMQNKHGIGETKPVFTFDHPAKGVTDNEGNEIRDPCGLPAPDNRRCATLTWEIEQDNMVHGFGGYFDCALYGDRTLSIVPHTHSPGMISWFPVFIPIKTPIRVVAGDTLTATFWRCVDSRRVWYEWTAAAEGAPGTGGCARAAPLHNINGRSSEMLL